MENEFFFGKTDFLVKKKGKSKFGNYKYEILDAKLARRAKAEHIIQLACYEELLESFQGVSSDKVYLIFGDGKVEGFDLKSFLSFYQALKDNFFSFHANFDPNNMPDPALYDNWGSYSEYAKNLIQQENNLSNITGIRKGQIKKFKAVGINTCEELLNTDSIKDLKINSSFGSFETSSKASIEIP